MHVMSKCQNSHKRLFYISTLWHWIQWCPHSHHDARQYSKHSNHLWYCLYVAADHLSHIPRCFICFHLRPFVVALARLLCCHSFTRYFVQCFASDYSISHTDYFGMFVMGIVTSFDFRRLCCKLACFHQSLEFLSGDEKQLAVHFCSFIIFWQFSPSIWCNCLAMTDVHYVVV